MKVPSSHNEAIELCQELYELTVKTQSVLSPEMIEEFEKLKQGLDYIELFISNTKE